MFTEGAKATGTNQSLNTGDDGHRGVARRPIGTAGSRGSRRTASNREGVGTHRSERILDLSHHRGLSIAHVYGAKGGLRRGPARSSDPTRYRSIWAGSEPV